jgi:hypothetical protein
MISGMDSGLRSDVGDLGFHICRLLLHLQLLFLIHFTSQIFFFFFFFFHSMVVFIRNVNFNN